MTVTFRDAFINELECLRETDEPVVAFSGSTAVREVDDNADPGAEPFAVRVPRDLAGIALSGGGIRSATFSLGLLQGLADRDVLRHFDYVSTVSGGGYVGGFWSAYRRRCPKEDSSRTPEAAKQTSERTAAAPRIAGTSTTPPRPAVPFPTDTTDRESSVRYARSEPDAIRHLREFSRFLAPRWGLFELETWQFFGGAVTAILPTVIVGLSVLTMFVWFMLIIGSESVGGLNSAVPTLWLLSWLRHVDITMVIVATSTLGVLWSFERETAVIERQSREPYYERWYAVAAAVAFAVTLLVVYWIVGDFRRWQYFEMFPAIGGADEVRLRFSAPALGWLAAMVDLILARTLASVFIARPSKGFYRAAIDRVIARLLGLAMFWLAMTTFVLGSFALWRATQSMVWTAGVGGVATALYTWIQRYLSRQPNRAKTGMVGKVLQRYTQPLLAAAALVALTLGCAFLVFTDIDAGSCTTLVVAVVVVAIAVLTYNPNEIGMHALYRSRLARAYLGASNRKARRAENNRQSTQRPGDDMLMRNLPQTPPLHLICCTANDLAGNHLANLSRGGRSAVLSPLGITVANRHQPWAEATTQVSLASAMTASAAAFNSNMGSVSMDLGPAATFLMTSLNLRLGYWYRFTTSRVRGFAPGLDFLAEMFRRTCSGPKSDSVHLSDGGHFENLGLYELLRRRCKYIVVSDCGADPDVAFDDVGNALRRAREDFGVEIEMDLGVLKPDEKRYSRQHLAVGDILYPDGDRGILLLFKPTLVGDEPGDILQYRARNEQFPHESTGDQFYDEKQWESYRRLGLHAARVAFRFIADDGAGDSSASEIFGDARWEWLPVPPDLEGQLLERTNQLEQLEKQLIGVDPSLMRDLFPELEWDAAAKRVHDDPSTIAKVLPLFTQVIQLMEDVYISCQMERYATHPLNLGWMNAFGRWATTPAFHDLWPFLAPMYNPQMTRFIESQFALASNRSKSNRVESRLAYLKEPAGVAFEIWRGMYPDAAYPGDRFWSYDVKMGERWVSVALLFATSKNRWMEWNDDSLFVPPSFWGARIGQNFVDALVKIIPKVRVEIPNPPTRRNIVHNLMQLYRQAGFIRVDPAEDDSTKIIMTRDVSRRAS